MIRSLILFLFLAQISLAQHESSSLGVSPTLPKGQFELIGKGTGRYVLENCPTKIDIQNNEVNSESKAWLVFPEITRCSFLPECQYDKVNNSYFILSSDHTEYKKITLLGNQIEIEKGPNPKDASLVLTCRYKATTH